ncbi:MAG: xanthine dehydrogenase family protein molybdopterin-binding subunit [Burkholderiales bacterium]
MDSTALGAAIPRFEDQRFLTGSGLFVDDKSPQGMAAAHVVRSPHAHARIRGIDKQAALSAAGVLAVLTGDDIIGDGIRGLPCYAFPAPKEGPSFRPLQPVLAHGKVRHVGDRVALVIAETPQQAKDAGELLLVDYEPLPAVNLENALHEGAALLWDESSQNLSFELERGNREQIDVAFAAAAHVTRLSVRYPRATANSIEGRSALAYADDGVGRWTLCLSTQVPHLVREVVCGVLNMPVETLRVIAADVGGAFGMKSQLYPEEILVLWAARRLNRPVKWTAERGESLCCDTHGRHQHTEAELALDRDGKILALRARVAIDLGAYLATSAGVAPLNAATGYTGTYDLPWMHTHVQAIFTNTSPTGPYRGSGKPEASFVMERLIDQAAREMRIDPVAMRRRNLIPASAMPFRTQGGYDYDGGDFKRVLDVCLRLADWEGFPARRAQSEARGLLRGIGLSMHCQRAGKDAEQMEMRFAANGALSLRVGTLSSGQGHETMYTQMASGWLGIPPEQIDVVQGDTDMITFGRGTFSQRSMAAGGSALKSAADEVIAKGRITAASLLEAAESDLEFVAGRFRIEGTDRSVGWAEIAQISSVAPRSGANSGALVGVGTHPGPNTYPNGCMIGEVEIDIETGRVDVIVLFAVDDVGAVINPLTLAGQLHGSIAQGLGESRIEEMVYDSETGQLITGSFNDYGMPRADDMPDIISELSLDPAPSNPLGVKGGSESGNVAAPAAIVNAIIDALSPLGVTEITLPATGERVWRAIREAAATSHSCGVAELIPNP